MTDKMTRRAYIGILIFIIMIIIFGLCRDSFEKECLKAGYDSFQISVVTEPDLNYHVICVKEIKEQIR